MAKCSVLTTKIRLIGLSLVNHYVKRYRIATAPSGRFCAGAGWAGEPDGVNVCGTNLIMRKMDVDTLPDIYKGHADVTALLDSSGNLVATYYYDAVGNILEKRIPPEIQ